MSEVHNVPSSGGTTAGLGRATDGRASDVADDHQVHYVPGDHRFEVTVDGETMTLPPLLAVCLVLQNRYLALNDSVAEKTEAMQDQVNQINEANDWLDALRKAEGPDGKFEAPSGEVSDGLQQWMDDNDIDPDDLGDPPDADKLNSFETQFSSYVDQLSSTNDLKMLQLKTAVNKAQEALAAADGVLQDLKQLMQTITGNMAH